LRDRMIVRSKTVSSDIWIKSIKRMGKDLE